MMEEFELRNLSPITADAYIQAVERFARYFNQSPARLGSEQVRECLLHLIEDKKVVANTLLTPTRGIEISVRGETSARCRVPAEQIAFSRSHHDKSESG